MNNNSHALKVTFRLVIRRRPYAPMHTPKLGYTGNFEVSIEWYLGSRSSSSRPRIENYFGQVWE